MAKAKKKAKKKTSSAAVPAKWGGRTFSFEVANGDIVKNPPNNFTLTPVAFGTNPPHMYVVTSASPGVTSFWQGAKVLVQDGKSLKMGFTKFPKPTGHPDELIERDKRQMKTILKVDTTKKRSKLERLVGFVPTSAGDALVSFFLAEKAFTDGAKGILIAWVDLPPGPAPGGAIVGNG